MRISADSSARNRDLTEIGEILSKGVELFLRANERERLIRNQPLTSTTESLPEDSSSLLGAVLEFGEITTSEAIDITGMSRSTARRRLAELVANGDLQLRGKGRGARYTLPD